MSTVEMELLARLQAMALSIPARGILTITGIILHGLALKSELKFKLKPKNHCEIKDNYFLIWKKNIL